MAYAIRDRSSHQRVWFYLESVRTRGKITKTIWSADEHKAKVFKTREEAQAEREKWGGRVVRLKPRATRTEGAVK